jgi:hypothetical protein
MHKETTEEVNKEKELFEGPPFDVAKREDYIKWVDKLRDISMHLIYAVTPETAWNNPENRLEVVLHGNTGQTKELPIGLYLILLPDGVPQKYKNALACAFAHLCISPSCLRVPLSLFKVLLNKPSGHEVFSAKMFIRKYSSDNAQDSKIQMWATQLLDQ